MRRRRMGRGVRRAAVRRRRHAALHAPGARALDPLLALLRGGVAPALAQHLLPRRRQLLEAAEVLTHRLALVRRQRLEVLPAVAQVLALIRRQRAPAREAVLRLGTLLR